MGKLRASHVSMQANSIMVEKNELTEYSMEHPSQAMIFM